MIGKELHIIGLHGKPKVRQNQREDYKFTGRPLNSEKGVSHDMMTWCHIKKC